MCRKSGPRALAPLYRQFVLVEHGQQPHGRVRCFQGGAQQDLEAGGDQGGLRRVEEIGAVAEDGVQVVSVRADVQAQFELGGGVAAVALGAHEVSEGVLAESAAALRVHGEERLEDGRTAGVTVLPQLLGEPFERYAAVRQGTEPVAADPTQDGVEGRIVGEVRAQDQRGGEVADGPLAVDRGPRRGGYPHAEVVLAGAAVE